MLAECSDWNLFDYCLENRKKMLPIGVRRRRPVALTVRLMMTAVCLSAVCGAALGLPGGRVTHSERDEATSYLLRFDYLRTKAQSEDRAIFSAAIASFQNVYHLPATGKLNLGTLAAMRQGRCGVGDSELVVRPPPRSPLSTLKPSDVRLRRSAHRNPQPRPLKPVASRSRQPRRFTWQLTKPSGKLPAAKQIELFEAAFRMWSEVAPVRFARLASAGSPDIEIGFYRGRHLNCLHSFEGPGGDTSHADPARGIHINEEVEFLLLDRASTSAARVKARPAVRVHLLRLLVHEIGHVLGLAHSDRLNSIMHPRAMIADAGGHDSDSEMLGRGEGEKARLIYGPCSTKIDAMLDLLSPLDSRSWQPRGNPRHNSTRIVSCRSVWQFDASRGQPSVGRPVSLGQRWPALKGVRVDALMQAGAGAAPLTLLFSGTKYYALDSQSGSPLPGYPRNISADFGPKPGHHYGIPDSVDAAYYDAARGRAVFVKAQWAFEYELLGRSTSTLQVNNCCERRAKLADLYHPAAASGQQPRLKTPLDAAYYRLNDSAVFLFSGDDFWRFGGPVGSRAANASASNSPLSGAPLLTYGGKVYSQWPGLCSAEPQQTCDLQLPEPRV